MIKVKMKKKSVKVAEFINSISEYIFLMSLIVLVLVVLIESFKGKQ